MAQRTKKKSDSGAVSLAVLGASLAGLAATAYFFLGPKGKKNQKSVKAWAIKMKGDVVERLEKAKEVSEPAYNEIIDLVAAEYAKGKKASREEIAALSADLKKHWKTLSRGTRVAKGDASKVAKKIKKVVSK